MVPGSALPSGVREGEVVAGKYRIGRTIGSGAMGTVVAARHLLMDEEVAIKFLLTDPEDHADTVARFLHEAQAAVRIRSEHVVRILDVDVLPGGAPYIVMEYLEGRDLAARLRADGPLGVGEAVDLVLQACEAMTAAHRMQIVHRDLKPANLFLAERSDAPPVVKVLDFGISKTLRDARLVARTLDVDEVEAETEVARAAGAAVPDTRRKAILGSPFYMSPEQMISPRDVDPRTDIWALGVTLFELVTGKYPFRGSTLVQVYSKIVSRGPAEWRTVLAEAPGAARSLEAILAKCLAAEPSARFGSVASLAQELAPFGSRPVRAALERIAPASVTPNDRVRTDTVVAFRTTGAPIQGFERAVADAEAKRDRPLRRLAWLLGPAATVGAVAGFVLATRFELRSAVRPAPAAVSARSAVLAAPIAPTATVTSAPLSSLVPPAPAPSKVSVSTVSPPPRRAAPATGPAVASPAIAPVDARGVVVSAAVPTSTPSRFDAQKIEAMTATQE